MEYKEVNEFIETKPNKAVMGEMLTALDQLKKKIEHDMYKGRTYSIVRLTMVTVSRDADEETDLV